MFRPKQLALVLIPASLWAALAVAKGQVLRVGSEDGESFAEIVVDPVEPEAIDAGTAPASLWPERSREILGTKLVVQIGEKVDDARLDRALSRALEPFTWAAENLSNADATPITSVNMRAGVFAVTVPAEVCPPVREALSLAEKTDGAFDPTRSPACTFVDYRAVEVRNTPFAVQNPPCTVRFSQAGMRLGLERFARAWALDRAADALRKEGFTRFLLRAGEVGLAVGTPVTGSWEVPLPRGAPAQKLAVADRAFAVTSDPDALFLDRASCRPVTGADALILASTATEALAWAHAVVSRDPGAAVKWLSAVGASGVFRKSEGAVSTGDLEPILWPPPPPDAGFRFP